MGEARKGLLYVVGTPIGNLEDLTDRARRVLREVDLVAAEDTRTAGRFLKRIGVSKPLVSVFEGNEHDRTPKLVEALGGGKHIALITESGTPTISDPGSVLVAACVERGIEVIPIPGPTAATTVLSACGLTVSRFRFEGFLPRRGKERQRRLDWLRRDPACAVLYESPLRLGETLRDLAGALGARRAVVAREVTKRYEEFARGTLPELAKRFENEQIRGEVTVVVEGALPDEAVLSDDEVAEAVLARLRSGASARDIASELAELTGRRRRDLYALAVRLRKEAGGGG